MRRPPVKGATAGPGTTRFALYCGAWAAASTVARLVKDGSLPERWQVAVAVSWFLNNVAVMVPGRYDGTAGDEKVTAKTANLFTPAGWAFGIWGPIFLGEWLMMLLLTFSRRGTPTFELGAAVAPGWCLGTLCQVGWCAAFRPEVCGPDLLWVPTVLLGGTAACLKVAHSSLGAVPSPYAPGPLQGLRDDLLVRWPLTLHFGWISAATLVNLNKFLALRGSSLRLKEAAALGSVLVAAVLAVSVFSATRDPLFGFVAAWALSAVASEGGKTARGLVPDENIDRVLVSAKTLAILVGLFTCLFPAVYDVAAAFHAQYHY